MKPWIAVTSAVVLAVAAAARLGGEAATQARADPMPRPANAELRRCREAGEAAVRDPDCRAAWRAERERFLGGRP